LVVSAASFVDDVVVDATVVVVFVLPIDDVVVSVVVVVVSVVVVEVVIVVVSVGLSTDAVKPSFERATPINTSMMSIATMRPMIFLLNFRTIPSSFLLIFLVFIIFYSFFIG
jgi:hypothetical protein